MAWGKCVIISLGLILLAHVAQARDIETFTDGQGILHITNSGSTKQKSPENLPLPATPQRPGNVPGNVRVTPSGRAPAPEAQAPAPRPKTVPNRPIPVTPRRGSRVNTEGSGGVMPVAYRTPAPDEPGGAAGPPSASIQRVAWSPPQPAKPVSNGKITIYRDHQGVIHITNVVQEAEEPAAPLSPAPVVLKQMLAPEVVLPTVRQVSGQELVVKKQALDPEVVPTVRQASCPELGAEVANYLEAKLRSHSPALTGNSIVRYKDYQGVWHIRNASSPDLQLPETRVAASTGQMTEPWFAHGPPAPPTPPAMARGPGFIRPPPGAADQQVVARRDHRGVLHIFTCASAEARPNRDGPLQFLARVSPALQYCIIEAAQRYRLPISLVLALIRKESNFAHQAVSPKGAMGLMQLMPGTAASLGVSDPFDPRENILAGCRYFRSLLDYFQGNVPLALAGYNAGYNRVISAGFQVPAIKETQEFVTQVMGLYYLLEKHAASL